MTGFKRLMDALNERAADSDLLALLGTSRDVRLHNAAIAGALRNVAAALLCEIEKRQVSALEIGLSTRCRATDASQS